MLAASVQAAASMNGVGPEQPMQVAACSSQPQRAAEVSADERILSHHVKCDKHWELLLAMQGPVCSQSVRPGSSLCGQPRRELRPEAVAARRRPCTNLRQAGWICSDTGPHTRSKGDAHSWALLYMQAVQGAMRHVQQYASEQPREDETFQQMQNGIKSPAQSPRKVGQHQQAARAPIVGAAVHDAQSVAMVCRQTLSQ